MPELESRWAQLASDVDGTGLAPAADLRHAADQRARRKVAVVAGAVVVAVVATGVVVLGRPAPSPGPTHPPSPSAEPTPNPTGTPASTTPPPSTPPTSPPTSAPPVVTSVPNRAFFAMPRSMQKGDPGDSIHPDEKVPTLCDDPLAADPTVTVRRTRRTYFTRPDDPFDAPFGSVVQTISVHRPGGAAEVMRRLRAELAECHSRTDRTLKFTVATERPPPYGDDAVHVVESYDAGPLEEGGGPGNHRIVVIRVGDVVTILWINTWEGGKTDPDDVDLFGRLAVEAIDDWR
jgi:hypothetical protein